MLRLILHWLSLQTKCAYWMVYRVDRYKGGTGVLYNNKFSNKLWTYAGVRASREYLNKFSSVVKFNISNEHALGWWPPKMKNQNLSSLNKFFKDHIFSLFHYFLDSRNEFLKECLSYNMLWTEQERGSATFLAFTHYLRTKSYNKFLHTLLEDKKLL